MTCIAGECKDYMVKFLSCLKLCSNDNSRCREESKAYLQCRMDRCVVHTSLACYTILTLSTPLQELDDQGRLWKTGLS